MAISEDSSTVDDLGNRVGAELARLPRQPLAIASALSCLLAPAIGLPAAIVVALVIAAANLRRCTEPVAAFLAHLVAFAGLSLVAAVIMPPQRAMAVLVACALTGLCSAAGC
ncbi:hypothetical protein ACH347_35220 [Saccharopolyspora sp. 5N102]|uniref:hypothetical protein n=1 Tax=Saccharopolyspora sp. 5N102 TaxID=3375155 RepID=UPI0037A016CE